MKALRNGAEDTPARQAATAEHAQASRALARGGVALLANSGITALFGVAYWVLAARILSAATVGRGSALVSIVLTVSGFCQLNCARSLSGLLPPAAQPRKLLAKAYGTTAALSVTIGVAAALIISHVADFGYLGSNLLFIAGFAGSIALWTVFNLEDAALTSVRRAMIIPFENGAYGLLKLGCLVGLWWAGYRTSLAVFASWVLPLIAVVVPVNLFLFLRAVPSAGPAWAAPPGNGSLPTAPIRRAEPVSSWLRYDFAGYLLWLAGTLPLPLLVLVTAGAASAASFYVPFTIATSIDQLLLMLGNSLTAELSRTHGVMTHAIRMYLRRVWILAGLMGGLLCLATPLVLQVFGDRYRVDGSLILRILMIAALPRSVLILGIAVQRSRGNGPAIGLLQALSALGTLTLGFMLIQALGAAGMALGWLLASCLAAAVTVALLARGTAPGSTRPKRMPPSP